MWPVKMMKRLCSKAPVIAGELGPQHSPPPANYHLSWDAATIEETCFGPDPDEMSDICASTDSNPFNRSEKTGTTNLFGRATSLYDISGAPGTHVGDPVADCFGGITYRCGAAVLGLADGCNWGPKPRKAARCAIFGATTTFHQLINKHVKTQSDLTTNQVFRMMREAMQAAQELITRLKGSQTTLTLSVIAKLSLSTEKWAVMTLSIGDSSAYMLRTNKQHRILDLTFAARGLEKRDMQVVPGALGFVDGEDPDLTNLSLSIATARAGDFVFLTSDGISDNFDPVARKLARSPDNTKPGEDLSLPKLKPAAALKKASKAVREVLAGHTDKPETIVSRLLEVVTDWTHDLRASASAATALKGQPGHEAAMKALKATPGKLDHVAVIAYRIPHTVTCNPRS